MATYTVHYIDGDSDVFEAEDHVIEGGIYTLRNVTSTEQEYLEVDLVIRNIFSIRRGTKI